jgi:hypothetical protein
LTRQSRPPVNFCCKRSPRSLLLPLPPGEGWGEGLQCPPVVARFLERATLTTEDLQSAPSSLPLVRVAVSNLKSEIQPPRSLSHSCYYPSTSCFPSKIRLGIPPSMSFRSLLLLPLPLGEGWGEGSFAAITIGCGQRPRQVNSCPFVVQIFPATHCALHSALRSLRSLRKSIPLFKPRTRNPSQAYAPFYQYAHSTAPLLKRNLTPSPDNTHPRFHPRGRHGTRAC